MDIFEIIKCIIKNKYKYLAKDILYFNFRFFIPRWKKGLVKTYKFLPLRHEILYFYRQRNGITLVASAILKKKDWTTHLFNN